MADEMDKDSGEKTEDPTSHRIEQFRKRGEVASSKELASVLILSAAFLTLVLSLVFVYEEMGKFIEYIFSIDADKAFIEKNLKVVGSKALWLAFKCTGPLFLVVFCVSILANVIQVGFLFSPDVLTFKPERINPIAGVKKLFSMRSTVEAFKGFMKFIFVMSIVYVFVRDDLTKYQGFMHLNFFDSFIYGKVIIAKLSFSIILGLLIVAIGDFAYQKYTYKKKLMMTKEEAKRDNKEHDGNPEVKQRIRTIQREMAQKRMMTEVPNADVIITNPTHLSIAVKYDMQGMISPEVIAKGADNIAMKIREIAKEHDIPIVENVPLARSLYKTVDIGSAVPRGLYKAVAEVLAFVYKLKRKKKALS